MPTGTVSHARSIIKAEELLKLLQDNALDPDAPPIHQNKLTTIKMLLNRSVSELKQVEHTGEVEHDIKVSWQK